NTKYYQLLLPHHHQAIADRKEDMMNSRIAVDFFVEGNNGFGIIVHFFFFLQHVSAPQHIVGNDVSSGSHFIENQIKIIGVIDFISINKNNVESFFDGWNYLERIT